MPVAEFDELSADIKANGQLEPIVTCQGLILDGRHRARACQELGLPVSSREWAGECGSPLGYVLSHNLRRRHLTSSQRAMLALELLPELEKQARERQGATQIKRGRPPVSAKVRGPGKAAEKAAGLAGVGSRYVETAKRIKREAPDLAEKVRTDPEFNLNSAKNELKNRWRESMRQENRRLVEATVPLDPAMDVPTPTLVLDPPWDYSEQGDGDPRPYSQMTRTRPVYNQMTTDEIAALPVRELTTKNAHVYLWIPNRLLAAGKGWELVAGWGFRLITVLTWCKPQIGVGNYYRNNTEHILFGVRGSLPLLLRNVGTHFTADRSEHSRKPDAFYELVERCSPGPWREMFVRGEPRLGWHGWGAEKAECASVLPLAHAFEERLAQDRPAAAAAAR